jgi:protein dithiol:quinone oxidoreductase
MAVAKWHKVFRQLTWLFLCACMGVIFVAYYQEYYQGMLPCVLCSVQRGVMVSVSLMLLLALIHQPKRRHGIYLWSGALLLLTGLGLLAAGRQWWLQWHPNSVDACLPGLQTLMMSMPLHEAVWLSWQGSSSCGDVIWRMLGINVVVWSMLIFVILMLHAVLRVVLARAMRTHVP